MLHVVFRHPETAIRRLYELVCPSLVIDGEPVATDGWAPHRLQLAAGLHRIQVRVPIDRLEELGLAEREVSIALVVVVTCSPLAVF